MKSDPGIRIRVVGHTDSSGDTEKNRDLSRRRAQAVAEILARRYGADASRIAAEGAGSSQPLEDNATIDGRALNRRVEILPDR
jgi:outer membrane protein OmpA-like peptidoglycan-associated protein